MSKIQINDLQNLISEKLDIIQVSNEKTKIISGGLFGRRVEYWDTDGDSIADEKRVFWGKRHKKTKYI